MYGRWFGHVKVAGARSKLGSYLDDITPASTADDLILESRHHEIVQLVHRRLRKTHYGGMRYLVKDLPCC